jgi:hypothetical protein
MLIGLLCPVLKLRHWRQHSCASALSLISINFFYGLVFEQTVRVMHTETVRVKMLIIRSMCSSKRHYFLFTGYFAWILSHLHLVVAFHELPSTCIVAVVCVCWMVPSSFLA